MAQREWTGKDYYADLGVSRFAPFDEIKKAYRKLARESHPDKNPGSKATEDKLRRISETYLVVGDEDKHRKYNKLHAALAGGFRFPGTTGVGGAGTTDAHGFDFDMSDLFGGGAGFGGNAGGAGSLDDFLDGFVDHDGGAGAAGWQKARRGADIETEITLDFCEAAQSVTIPLQFANLPPHTNHNSSGAALGISPVTCTTCYGSGYVKEQGGAFGLSSPRADCGDQGTRIGDSHSQCNGADVTTRRRIITVCVPASAVDGRETCLADQGEAGLRGYPVGNLFITVHVHPDEVFTRNDNDFRVAVPVSSGELALGNAITAPALGDEIRVHIPAGTTDDRILRVRGRRTPKRNDILGDLLITVRVRAPTNLDDNVTSALRSYIEAERASGFNPREGWTSAK